MGKHQLLLTDKYSFNNFRSKIKTFSNDQLGENRFNLNQYNLQDILEPLAKASAGTVRSQYLSVSRYVAGQPSGVRRDSNISLASAFSNRRDSKLFSKQSGKTYYPNKSTYHQKVFFC